MAQIRHDTLHIVLTATKNIFEKKNSTNSVKTYFERLSLVYIAECTTFYKNVKRIKRRNVK